jgi:hypothetical protein
MIRVNGSELTIDELARPAIEMPRPFQDRAPRRRSFLALAAPAAVAIGFALAFAWPRPTIGRLDSPLAAIQIKGTPIVTISVTRGDRVRRGSHRETVRPHDRIQLYATTPAPTWVAVFGDDSAGARSLYYVAHVPVGREQLLPLSIEIGAALGDEILTAMFCPEPFNLAAPPASCVTDRFRLVKLPRL